MAIVTQTTATTPGDVLQVLELPDNTINAMSDINLLNTGTVDAFVTVYITDAGVPTAEHAIEWETKLSPSLPLSRTCGPMKASEKMFVVSSVANVSIRATAIIETL